MSNNLEKEESKNSKINIKEKVLRCIKEKGIKIRSPFVILAEKLGLESALAISIIFGALLVSIFLYFLKKTGVIKFLSLGIPGLKIFLSALPYDYIVLFIITLILAIYLANKISLFCGDCSHTDLFVVFFLAGTLFLGIVFAILGAGEFLRGRSECQIPRDSAIHGRVEKFSDSEVMIQENGDGLVTVYFGGRNNRPEEIRYETGKFLRAIGKRDRDNQYIFHAERIRCCDDY